MFLLGEVMVAAFPQRDTIVVVVARGLWAGLWSGCPEHGREDQLFDYPVDGLAAAVFLVHTGGAGAGGAGQEGC